MKAEAWRGIVGLVKVFELTPAGSGLNASSPRLCFLFVLIAALAWAGRAQAQSNFYTPVPTQGIFLKNLSYGYDPGEVLNVCRPASDGKLHPGLIMIHGGRWIRDDQIGPIADWCPAFAKLGYVVTDIQYRLDSLQNPNPNWPAFQIGDVQLAIRWMRFHAQELGLDSTRICAYGESAGAYLAVFAATQQTIYPSDVNWIAPMMPVNLSCLVDGFGPVDLTVPSYQPIIFSELLGFTLNENPVLYRYNSPVFYVGQTTPPTFVIYGTQDTTVPIAQSVELYDTLRRSRILTRMITYVGGHAYHGLNAAGRQHVFTQIFRFLAGQIGP